MSSVEHFVRWAKKHAIPIDPNANIDAFQDLEPLKEIIGSAQVVGLGESHHYTREFNRFRSRLFRFLVTEMGFTTFVLEVGLVEAKRAHDYVLLLHDDADDAFMNVNQTFGLWAEQQEMLQWMRDYNCNVPESHRIRFYGMDGSEGWSHTATAVAAACDYLERVDPAHAAVLRMYLVPLAKLITIYNLAETSTEAIRELVHGLTDLVGRFEVEKIQYIERSSPNDFDWGLRSALLARQICTMLCSVRASPNDALRVWNNVRDFNMAANLKWILDREGPGARLLVGAHNAHLQNAYDSETTDGVLSTMGQYISTLLLETETVMIAGTSYDSLRPDDPATPDSNQAALALLEMPSFVLDLRPASLESGVADWLSEKRPERVNIYYQQLSMGEAYDALFFIRDIALDRLNLPAVLKQTATTLNPDLLDGLVGIFRFSGVLDDEDVLHVMRDGDRLMTNVGVSNGELFPMHKTELFAISDTEFFWREWPMRLEFERDSDGVAQRATIYVPTMHWIFHGRRCD